PYGYSRRPSAEVALGDLHVGGTQPVRVELAPTVPLAHVDETLAQIRALCTPAHPGAPVCEIVRLRATSPADLEAFATLRQRLSAAGPGVSLALHLPLALLGALTTLPEAAKFITTPDPGLSEETWHEQVRHCAALVGQHGAALEWALALDV